MPLCMASSTVTAMLYIGPCSNVQAALEHIDALPDQVNCLQACSTQPYPPSHHHQPTHKCRPLPAKGTSHDENPVRLQLKAQHFNHGQDRDSHKNIVKSRCFSAHAWPFEYWQNNYMHAMTDLTSDSSNTNCCRYFLVSNGRMSKQRTSKQRTNLTFEPSISIRTKLGFTSIVMVLYAPVADPGLIRRRSSCLYAWPAPIIHRFHYTTMLCGLQFLKHTDPGFQVQRQTLSHKTR